MKALSFVGIVVLSAAVGCTIALAQAPTTSDPPAPTDSTAQPSLAPSQPPVNSATGPVDLNWTPPGLAQLSAEATVRSSLSLDRAKLEMAASLIADSEPETRQAIAKLDGVSMQILRFGPAGIQDEPAVNDIRAAYHLRGWKHLATNTAVLPASANPGGPLHNSTTDVWCVLDGVNVRGAVVLVVRPRSLTLITLAGNISPVDMLHLRGHFGIPRIDSDQFKDAGDR
jgi:hypothetical protein